MFVPMEQFYGGTYGPVELINVSAVTRDAPLAEETGNRGAECCCGTERVSQISPLFCKRAFMRDGEDSLVRNVREVTFQMINWCQISNYFRIFSLNFVKFWLWYFKNLKIFDTWWNEVCPTSCFSTGAGMYFADVSTKSLAHAHPQGNLAMLLVCEVALGKSNKVYALMGGMQTGGAVIAPGTLVSTPWDSRRRTALWSTSWFSFQTRNENKWMNGSKATKHSRLQQTSGRVGDEGITPMQKSWRQTYKSLLGLHNDIRK